MEKISIKAEDGSGGFDAYVAHGPQSPAGVVVLIQEIFGVNESMKETARQIAEQGYHVLVPDLFWRLQPGVDLTDKTEAEWKQAFDFMNRFDQAKGVADLKSAVAFARSMEGSNGKVGTMGYCLGGRLAMMMATDSDADVNISYYGVGLDGLLGGLDRISAPLLLHIADEDKFFPAEARAKVVEAAKARPHVHAYTYPNADHAFARVGGQHWQARAATIANGRSAEALAAALG
ncbi:MAG: dienelactone hydrolase family protein [Acetobacteraceae bacterium]|nr:dienelactone hydrolase family protein [Acetobacteraceae bacterium]